METTHRSRELTTQRLEAFSDGVFAIAITLLVLDMRVPHASDAQGPGALFHLSSALLKLWPSYFAYVFSFVMIGIFWVCHHYLFQLFKRTDQWFLLLNVFLLICIAFLPFPTAAPAEYITDSQQRQTAMSLYVLALFLPAFAWLLMWLYASHRHRLLDKDLDPAFVSYLTRRYLLSNLLYVLAIPLSLWNGLAGLALCVGLTLVYVVPLKPPVYRMRGP